MTTLPGQDASLPAQQPYIAGQQPMFQQVSHAPASFDPLHWFILRGFLRMHLHACIREDRLTGAS